MSGYNFGSWHDTFLEARLSIMHFSLVRYQYFLGSSIFFKNSILEKFNIFGKLDNFKKRGTHQSVIPISTLETRQGQIISQSKQTILEMLRGSSPENKSNSSELSRDST